MKETIYSGVDFVITKEDNAFYYQDVNKKFELTLVAALSCNRKETNLDDFSAACDSDYYCENRTDDIVTGYWFIKTKQTVSYNVVFINNDSFDDETQLDFAVTSDGEVDWIDAINLIMSLKEELGIKEIIELNEIR